MAIAALAAPVFVPAARDRVTPAVAAVALAAIVVLPWALGGGTSALWRAATRSPSSSVSP